MTTTIWECKIGEVHSVAGGADYLMRQAVADAYKAQTGVEPVFIFSGWGASLTEAERAAVENRLPAPATAPDLSAAYIGAREDLAIWKKRALEAEETARQLNRALAEEVNGPTFMGEPVLPATAPAWHVAPTVPGLWVSSVWNARYFSAGNVANFHNRAKSPRWYGPIPEDKS